MMKGLRYFTFFLVFTALTIPAVGQEIDKEIIDQIKKEGLENSRVMEIAFFLTDVSGPRLSGSSGLKSASEWARDEMTRWGLENANLEPWGEFGRGWETNKMYVAMTEPYYSPLIGMAKAWTPGTNGPKSAEVTQMIISSGEELDQYEGKLEGKIVLINSIENLETSFEADASRFTTEQLDEKTAPSDNNRHYNSERWAEYRKRRALFSKMREFAMAQGAVAIVSGRRGKHGTFFTSNGASRAVDAVPVLPEIELAPEHAARMTRLLNHGIPVKLEIDVETSFLSEDMNGYNVIAEIPGTDENLKDELVMLGGHLDSWHAGTGATDNAAGCAVMMEVVRILKTLDVQPRRTIRIALWTGEEQGIFGSRAYVKNHFGDAETMTMKPEHEKLSAYYNIDNGTGRIRGIYLQGNEAVRPIFEDWLKPFDDMIDHTTVTINNTGGTDHLGFNAVGLPGFQFIQDPIAYDSRTHHTNMDTYERLVEEDLKQIAVIVATFVYNTAMRDEKIPRKPVEKMSTGN